jgi:hypothetical protein
MSRQLTDTLKNPDGTTLNNAEFELVATVSTSADIVKGASSTFSTNGSGLYDVTVEDGTYAVFVTHDNTKIALGSITVTTGSASTINSLLNA